MNMSHTVKETGKISIKKIFRFSIIWFHLLGKLIHHKPNLCYFALTTTGVGFKKDVLLIALLSFFRVKMIYHIHNKGIIYAKKKRLNHLLYQFVFLNRDVIILSKHLYYDVEAYVPQKNIYICHNGIKDYQPKIEFLSLPEIRPFNILFFSNLIKDKGVLVLIDACSLLKDNGFHFRCDFVGGEADVTEEQFNKYVFQKGLTGQVRYLGKRYGKLKEMAFEQADVFVLPSRYDCFPLVILEAMQHKLPVITANEGGMPDMVKDGYNGYLLSRYDDVPALAEKIEHLLLNPALRIEMGDNGRVKYEKRFTDKIFEKKLLDILKKVIN